MKEIETKKYSAPFQDFLKNNPILTLLFAGIFIYLFFQYSNSTSTEQSRTNSLPTTTAILTDISGTPCNGSNYDACPKGQNFICPANGKEAYCQLPSEQDTTSQSQKNQNSPASDGGYSALVSEWSKRVAYVTCSWTYADGTVYRILQGSSLLVNIANKGVTAVTNKHVIYNNGSLANRCTVSIAGVGARMTSENNFNSLTVAADNRDWGEILIDSKFTSYAYDKGIFDTNTNPKLRVCSDNNVDVGDKLIVLGYPTIGTSRGVTVTDGIISGIEDDYYVTDAKIDHGNSGGAAVLVKDNCYLGIPTWVANNGGFESLGRILKGTFPLKS